MWTTHRRRLAPASLVIGFLVRASPLAAAVNLEWRPAEQTVNVGDVVHIGLYAVSDGPEPQGISALAANLQWEASHLELSGVTNNGPYRWLQSGFPNDSGLDGLNNTWQDGDARYECLAMFSQPAMATAGGLLVTTVRFEAVSPGSQLVLEIPPSLGQWSRSQVFGADFPNHDITGTLGQALVTIVPESSTLTLWLGCAITASWRRRGPRFTLQPPVGWGRGGERDRHAFAGPLP